MNATLLAPATMRSFLFGSPDSDKNLLKDEGGAIMIMGLAMIMALIAFMWYILGIGETLAFRDHMQDAADSAAFSQTAVEAAGMNLIVLLNMILMLLVIVYLILSILVTLNWATLVICIATIVGDIVGACEVEAVEYDRAWNGRNDVASILSKIDMGISILESGVAVLAPWAGTAGGIDASMSFKMSSQSSAPIGLSVSPNNFPDTAALTSLGRKTGVEYGLPVTHEHLGNDCAHLIDMTAGAIENLFGGGKKAGKIMSILNKGVGAMGSVIQWYYCDDGLAPFPLPGFVKDLEDFLSGIERELIGGGDGASYWVTDGYGPMENFKHVEVIVDNIPDAMKGTKKRHDKEQKNGADHNQSYSVLVMPGDLSDHHATHNMGFMQMQHLKGYGLAEDAARPLFYFAQSELYFDCGKGWRSPDCDDITDNLDHVDMTMYSFAWRARLVKFHPPEGGAIDKVLSFINKGLQMVTDVKGFINGGASNPFIQALQFIDKLTGINIIGFIGSLADIPPTQIFH